MSSTISSRPPRSPHQAPNDSQRYRLQSFSSPHVISRLSTSTSISSSSSADEQPADVPTSFLQRLYVDGGARDQGSSSPPPPSCQECPRLPRATVQADDGLPRRRRGWTFLPQLHFLGFVSTSLAPYLGAGLGQVDWVRSGVRHVGGRVTWQRGRRIDFFAPPHLAPPSWVPGSCRPSPLLL
ncbi:hypothetical protein BKA80DRAFT_11215 [Phyllosticta citrichinensis]